MKKFFDLQGKQVPNHSTMAIDHVEQVFTVRIKSSSGITSETVKNIIQSKHEVLDVKEEIKISRGTVCG
jgi:hypothetical protein